MTGDERERELETADFALLRRIDEILEPELALPEKLSNHKIIGQIGAGGMGRVLLAVDEALGRKVAIKILAERFAANAGLRARFLREARALAQLNHPNVVRIYNLGPASEPPHFVMEYVEGASLTVATANLNFRDKALLMRKVALSVAFLHENGVIHRDLKPANILVGPDREPKLVDFGLALETGASERLSLAGEVVGTPEYFSPEQASGAADLDARSDIFALGAILYELLTGAPPFAATSLKALLEQIRAQDPELPRRKDPGLPKDLQSICLKALEKDPADRYASAREMAADLERFLAGEPVLAAPRAYSRLIAERVEQHIRELDGWRRDQVISDGEFEGLRKRYLGLADHEDAWIMQARRLTLPQVTLYLGAWMLAVGAALLASFRYGTWAGVPAVATVMASALWIGLKSWRGARFRIAIAYLIAFCLLLPLALIVITSEAGLFGEFTRGRRDLELFARLEFEKPTTNARIWWSLLLALPAALWLRRFTRSSVFSLSAAAMLLCFVLTTLLRMGAIEWLEKDAGRFYLYLIPCSVLFLGLAAGIERAGKPDDSRYFYPAGVVLMWAAMSGLALFHEPYAEALRAWLPWTRGQVEYLFMANAAVYFLLDVACQAIGSAQSRAAGKAFRFIIPGHILTSLWILGVNATERFGKDGSVRGEHTAFLWLLPAAATVFVFGSIPKQMKNFFVSGLVFLAIGLFRLQQHVFARDGGWPVALLAAGFALMLMAANYSWLRMAAASRWKS